MKRKWKKRILISLLIVFCMGTIGIVGLKVFWDYKSYQDDEANQLIAQAQYLANAIRVRKTLEKYGIELTQDYVDAINENGVKLINLQNIREVEVTTIGEMLYIANELDNRKNKQLQQKLDEYYDKDKKIFSQYPYKCYQDKTSKDEHVWIALTITLYNELNDTELLDYYNIEEGLAEWYQLHINDANEKTNLVSIFWLLYESDKLNLIKESTICSLIKNDIQEEKNYLEKEEENSMTTLFYADEVNAYYSYFKKNNDYVGFVEKIFCKINSSEQLEYNKDDISFIIFVRQMIESIDNITENSFFIHNISEYLEENYKTCYLE